MSKLPLSSTSFGTVFLLLASWVASAPCAVAQAEPDSSAYVVWTEGIELDFGFVEARGVERFDSFYLHNPTEEAFLIESIRPSCGCTAVDYPVTPIEPGETVAIPVAFRCTKGGYVERHLDVWLSHLSMRERLYVLADCPRR